MRDPFPYKLDYLNYISQPQMDAFGAVEKGINTSLSRQYSALQNERAQEMVDEYNRQRTVENAIAENAKANPNSSLEEAYRLAAQTALQQGLPELAIKFDKAAQESQFSPLPDVDLQTIQAMTGVKLPTGTTYRGAALGQAIKASQAMDVYRNQSLALRRENAENMQKWRMDRSRIGTKFFTPQGYTSWANQQIINGGASTFDDYIKFLQTELPLLELVDKTGSMYGASAGEATGSPRIGVKSFTRIN